jgi:Holliday junction resolvase
MTNAKKKGAAGERELANILKGRGFSVYRTYASGAGQEKGDVKGLEASDGTRYHIEVKRQERFELNRWWDQAVKDCSPEETPLLVFRRSHEEWRVVITLDDLLDLLEDKSS